MSENNYPAVGVRIPVWAKKFYDEHAAKEDRPLSYFLRQALIEYAEKHGAVDPAKSSKGKKK